MTALSPLALAGIPGLVRCEQFDREAMAELLTELTHGVYPHEQVYGDYCTNWREALELAPGVHHDTFARLGNLFGAALPINLEDALASRQLEPGTLVCLAGFSHAGYYAAAAVIRWRPSRHA